MRRDTLELADDGLFIERIKLTFTAADAEFVIRAHAFLSEKACADDSIAHKAAALLIEQGADTITVAAALLTPLLWRACINPSEIRERFGLTVAAPIEDLCSPFIPIADDRQLRRRDIHAILSSIGSVPRKALLFITFRLIALQKNIGSSSSRSRKMAQDTLDLLVPITDRLALGDLRRRLEDTCFRLLDPAGYERLEENVAPIQAEDGRCLRTLLAGVRHLLNNNGIQGRVQGRTKSLHGIRRKMGRKGKPLQEIMDRIGLRVIVASVPVLGLLHRQVFQGHVVVFGNGGRIVRLDENATVRGYLNIVNVRISEDSLVKVNGRKAALNLTLRDGDSIEVLAEGDQSTTGIETCANRVNGSDVAGSMYLLMED